MHSALLVSNGQTQITQVKDIAKELCQNGKTDFSRVLREGTSIKLFAAHYGMAEAGAAIYKLIEYMNLMLNVYAPMNRMQMEDLAEEFVTELTWVTMEDMAIFFVGIPKQYWGHINNRMDAAVVWELWDVYCSRRNDFFYNQANEHKQLNVISEKSNQQEARHIGEALNKIANKQLSNGKNNL